MQSQPRSPKTKSKKAAIPEAIRPADLIAKKRDGNELSEGEIRGLIEGFVDGGVADYQMSAMAMAIFLRGMTDAETTALTLAMRDSGKVLSLPFAQGKKVDKHSTGGVGDKVSISLAPLVAACGVTVPMVSGRGLGHTGGTLDKLEAIPGFRVDLPTAKFISMNRSIGCSLIGQTKDIAPADRRLYALRDVTATVESIPLITASILSKKLAEGIDGLVLDVKVGRGAFMKTEKDARALAASIVRVGKLAKKKVIAVLTRMDEPLGRTVGNALETKEALEFLHGHWEDDYAEITFALARHMLLLAKVAKNENDAQKKLEEAIRSGEAISKMKKIVAAQGGDARVVDEPNRLAVASHKVSLLAPSAGVIAELDALEVGLAAVALGAGRARAEDTIDPGVGFVIHRKVGQRVQKGEELISIHAKNAASAELARKRLFSAIKIGVKAPRSKSLVIDTIR